MFEKHKARQEKKAEERKKMRMTDELSTVVKYQFQCTGCTYNTGSDECDVYGTKLPKYKDYTEVCPARKEFTW